MGQTGLSKPCAVQSFRTVVTIVALTAILVGVPIVGMGQAQPYVPFRTERYFDYNAAKLGPLLIMVEPGTGFDDIARYTADQKETVIALLDERGKRVTVGGLNVIAPKTMQIIEARPRKRPAYAEMPAEQRLFVLLSFFDEKQWAKACNAQGIGQEEMDDRERAMFVSLLPEKMVTLRSRVVADADTGPIHYEDVGRAQWAEPLAARLRLVRKLNFGFTEEKRDSYDRWAKALPGPGEEICKLADGEIPRGDTQPSAADTVISYGSNL